MKQKEDNKTLDMFECISTNLERVTENGEICKDLNTKEYVVFDETYAYEVGRTHYPKCAEAMLEAYCEEYLEG